MIAKTPLGVTFFDARHGGIYQERATLVCGAAQTGKTVLAFQFLREGLRRDERGLMLSTRQAADLTICADALGMPISSAVDREDLTLLEYSDFQFEMDRSDSSRLPPDGFNELKEIIETHAIRRIVIDTIVPWVAIHDTGRLGQHVLSFVRAFDRLGATTLMTLPKPVSPMAHKLRKVLEQVIPVCLYLKSETGNEERFFQVTKYLGEKALGPQVRYEIVKNQGLVEAGSRVPASPPSGDEQPDAGGAPVPPPAATRPSAPASKPRGAEESPKPIRFAGAVPGLEPEHAAGRNAYSWPLPDSAVSNPFAEAAEEEDREKKDRRKE